MADTRRQQFLQAFRAHRNLMESDLASLYIYAHQAYGTAGSTPFASNLSDLATLVKASKDHGAPQTDLKLVMDTTAGLNLRSIPQLTKANEAGTSETLRKGTLLELQGFELRESAGIVSHTAGTGTGYLVNNGAGYAVGSTSITLDTGTGTILPGDVVTFTGDTTKYVAQAYATNVLTLNGPGLLKALVDNTAMTIGASYTPNLAYSMSALVLGARLPELGSRGDASDDTAVLSDPGSGVNLLLASYGLYHQRRDEIGCVWGTAATMSRYMWVLMG
jgi:hypothetical protein